MCGIVAYTGSADAVPILLKGLKSLEYRGYDSAGVARFYLNGVLVDIRTLGGDLSNWDPAFDFGLGNEFSVASTDSNTDWLGEYRLVAVYNRALSEAELQQNFLAGPGA